MILASHLQYWLPQSQVSSHGRAALLDALAHLRKNRAITVGTKDADVVLSADDFREVETLEQVRHNWYRSCRVIVRKA